MRAKLQKQLEECLDPQSRRRWTLRFPKELEARYEIDQRDARTRETLLVGAVAIVIFNLFLFSDFAMNPAAIRTFLFYRLCIFTPLGLLALHIVYREKRRVLGEPLMTTVVVGASFFWLVTCFDHNAAISMLALTGQVVYLIFGTIVLRLSLPYAVAINILLTLQALAFARWDKWMSATEGVTSLCLVAASSLLALFTNYRLEAGQRKSYLLLLREDFRSQDLALLNETLATKSNHDGLTGLANRRYLNEYIQKVWDLAAHERGPVSIVMADVDHFKELNDSFGHVLGDIVLVALAEILRSSVRGSEDLVARFGGEEFVIVFPGMERSQACETAERLCVNVRNTAFNLPGSDSMLRVRISCGVGSLHPVALLQPVELIAQADEALYRAKRAGRDQVCCGEQLEIGAPQTT